MRGLEKPEKPIGWNGQTLRGMLTESEKHFEKTGRYWGLEDLAVKSSRPILYEKIFSKIRGGLVNARETAMNVSASPIVKEIGELCFALYTAEGDSVALSTGIIVHVHTMSDAIKYMIRHDFEDNPGIAPGDIYINTDPLVGDVHNGDVQTLVPLFWEGEIIGWAGGVTHEIDIGALTPGSVPVGPTNRFEDGIDCPVLKCGAKDTLFRDHELRCEKATRTPMFWKLDERARIAGCHMIRRTVEEIVQEVGIETYKAFAREVIEEGRRSFLSRIREMTVPGRYRASAFSDYSFSKEARLPMHARVDKLMHAPLEINIHGDGTFELGFEGADAWGWHSMNCTPSAMQGAIWVLLSQTVIPNDKVNDGAYLATRSNFPLGSWTNPGVSSVSTGISWFFLIPAFTGLFRTLGRAFQARGYVEEVLSGYGLTGNCFQGGGTDQFGKQSATTNFELSCVGTGAGAVRDGLDFAAAMWNPEGDMGDVEVWELIEPFLYLGRRIKPNTAGPGKYRGGSGFESLRMCWKTPFYELQNINGGKAFPAAGIFGGYPCSAGYRRNLHQTNILELAKAQRPYPVLDGDPGESEILRLVKAKRIDSDKLATTLPGPFEEGDLYLSVLNGGTGVGDPIEREPDLVEKDLNGDYLLPGYAESIYGAVIGKENGRYRVYRKETDAKRREIKKRRQREAVPVRSWMETERKRIQNGGFEKPVREMYRSSMAISKIWAKEFREFWGLPDDFELKEQGGTS
jgi:N-methylhydantoinase B/acetone carboxylase alpha subunit